jgi:hypothetical protein
VAFRVETSAEAECNAEEILDLLLSRHAGDTGVPVDFSSNRNIM